MIVDEIRAANISRTRERAAGFERLRLQAIEKGHDPHGPVAQRLSEKAADLRHIARVLEAKTD